MIVLYNKKNAFTTIKVKFCIIFGVLSKIYLAGYIKNDKPKIIFNKHLTIIRKCANIIR